jgi:nucleoside-diphosphate-sugar epimerase
VVFVSGADGSIGAELCRQVLRHKARRLVLLQRSEPSLHATYQELSRSLPRAVELVAVLGSASDAQLVSLVLQEQGAQVVFHAAAYKHVRLVQANPLAGLANSVLGILVLARAAFHAGVASFTLISTDKGVRPANFMGASKRAAELLILALAQERPATRLVMVRFGNVFGASVSVVPMFREQIAKGGPITLTHPEIVRFLITIPDAAQLVLQVPSSPGVASCSCSTWASFCAFSIRPTRWCASVACLCTMLSTPRAKSRSSALECAVAKKLYEKLLIDVECEPTTHPLIYRAIPSRPCCPSIGLAAALAAALAEP